MSNTTSFSEKLAGSHQAGPAAMLSTASQPYFNPRPSRFDEWLPQYETDVNANMRAFDEPDAHQSGAVLQTQQRTKGGMSRRLLAVIIVVVLIMCGVIAGAVVGALRMKRMATENEMPAPSLVPRSSSAIAEGLVVVTVTVTAAASSTSKSLPSDITMIQSTTTDITTVQTSTTAAPESDTKSDVITVKSTTTDITTLEASKITEPEGSSSKPTTSRTTTTTSSSSTMDASHSAYISSLLASIRSEQVVPEEYRTFITSTTSSLEPTTSAPSPETTLPPERSEPAPSTRAKKTYTTVYGAGMINWCGAAGSACAKKRRQLDVDGQVTWLNVTGNGTGYDSNKSAGTATTATGFANLTTARVGRPRSINVK